MKQLRTFATALTLTITLLGTATVARAGFNNALSFDGSSQYVSVPGFGNIIPTTEVTVEFWAYANAIGQNSAFMLQPDDPANRFQSHISFDNGNTYWDFGDIFTSGRILNGNPPDTVGNWVHYALVVSQGGNFMKIYTNGNLFVSQAGMTPFIRGDYELRIGGGDFKLNGRLDDFRVWSVARSQLEIQANYTAPLNGDEANLLVYYRFDSASGTVATNSATATGAAYDGTLVNSPAWGNSGVLTTIVSNANDFGAGSLRQAISDALNGYTITFDPSLSGQTITLTNGELLLNKNLTIDGGTNGIVINGNNASRVFEIAAGVTNIFIALTITNGSAFGGGGIDNRGTLTVNQCTLSGNSALVGGGILNQGTLTVNQSTLSGNSADEGGGGILNFSTLTVNQSTLSGNSASFNGGGGIDNRGTLTVNQSTVSGNSAARGGGINNEQGTMTMSHCTVSGNTATGVGGGIVSSSGTMTMTQCTVSGNTAGEDGGGIYNSGGLLTMNQCTVSGNTATGVGGGIYNDDPSTLTMNQCTVSGNTATDGHGGGIYNFDGTLMMTQCTVSGNTASDRGGGIYSNTDNGFTSNFTSLTNCTIAGNTANGTGGGIRNNDGLTTLTFCTVSGNTSPDGAGAWTYGDSATRTAVNDSIIAGNMGSDVISQDGNALSFISGGYNLIGSGDNSYFNQSGDVVNLTGVGLLAPLANYGGPTMTMPPLPRSPAIDAAIGATLTTDQRGFPRPVDGDTNGVAIADIGAVEFSPLPPLAGSYNGLFFETAGVVHEHSGFFTAKLAATRKFSGKFMLAGKKYSLSGQFNGLGYASNSIARTGLSSLTVRLYSIATNEIFGLVSDGTWTAALNSDRAVFNATINPCPQAARYTMQIPGGGGDPATSPIGFGFGAVTIDAAGKITLKGLLPDGTKIGQKTLLSKDGQWPLYVPIKTGGSILSWVTVNRAAPMSGDIVWTKKANPLAKIYPLGFTNMNGIIGSRFIAPAPGTRILGNSSHGASFNGGNFNNSVVLFTLGTDNKVTSSTPGFSLKFNTATGLFSGKVIDPVTFKPVPFAGAVNQTFGAQRGFFLNANQSGLVFIK